MATVVAAAFVCVRPLARQHSARAGQRGVDRHAAPTGYFPYTRKGDPRVEGYSLTGIDLLFQWEFKRR